MKFTLNWLKQHLETTASLEQIVEKLTALGLEVESVTDKSKDLSAFKIAKIMEATQHPDADRLRICRVNTGTEELQIVCGAPNARAGINVVLASVGAVIPNGGFKIKASKIRGVDSNGMLCSASELCLSDDSEGIIEMPASNENLGKNFVDVAGLNDPVIEIAITPNCGDCLGVYGVARDLAASGIGTLKPLNINPVNSNFTSPITVSIQDESACPVFVGRYFKNVKNGASPEWLQNRLKAIGLKPISALVDITNYINYEFGRPLHVYDASKLSGNLEVRFASDEKFTALDNKEYKLDSDILVIADSNGAQAVGGVIGGLASGCSETTTDVFLEVALFNPDVVTKSGRKLEINTDSRYRFERKVDPAFVLKGMEIASAMIIDLCGGEASEPVIAGSQPKFQHEITLPQGFVTKYSGVEISDAEITNILTKLGFIVTGDKISVPSWRPDVEGAPDLVEEVLRVHGYDKIEELGLGARGWGLDTHSPAPNTQNPAPKLRNFLASRGLTEVITWSFMEKSKASLFGEIKQGLVLKNPISSELDYMRNSILPNLLDALARNAARGASDLAFFEIGPVFTDSVPGAQSQSLTGILSGKHTPRNVHSGMRDVDVFDAKAHVLAALEEAGAPASSLRIEREAASYYHPGKSGVLKLGKTVLGVFGELHPSILKKWDLKTPVMAFEVHLDNIPAQKAKKSTAKPKLEKSDFQASTRDFAFIIDAKVAASDILKAANVDKILVRDVDLFDVYQGKNIDADKKSIAISIKIQPNDRTLTESELEDLSKKVIAAVEKLGGVLRG